MKTNSILLLVLLCTCQVFAQEVSPADRVLQRVARKLASVRFLSYKHRFAFNSPSEGRSIEENANVFFDLQPDNPTEQFRFRSLTKTRLTVYNGSEQFVADDKTKKLYVENSPSFDRAGHIVLQNSPLALKYALPKLVADKAIAKKLTSGPGTYLLEFSLPKAAINSIGRITAADQTSHYRLTVDRKTYLPLEVIETNDKNDEVWRTGFSDISERPTIPSEASWYFSTYQATYQLERREKLTLINAGTIAANFSLPRHESNDKVTLDLYRDKPILLEFWIAHCEFCIAAVPKLNQLAAEFRDKGLELVSINMYDPPATIDFFKKKNGPKYSILTGGDSIAKAYGVEAYPAFVLIGRDGKIVYSSSGLQEKELAAAIIASLKE